MSLFKSRQTRRQSATLEDWLREIKHFRNPLDLTVFLLSPPRVWAFKEKVQVLLSLPKKAIRDAIGMDLLETRLEDAGQPQLAQVLRWLSFQNLPWHLQVSNRLWCYMKMCREEMLGEAVQQSAYIKEELQALQMTLDSLETSPNNNIEEVTDRNNRINQYQSELQLVEATYQDIDSILGGCGTDQTCQGGWKGIQGI